MAAKKGQRDGKYWYKYIIDSCEKAESRPNHFIWEFITLKGTEQHIKMHIKTLRNLGATLDMTTDRVKNNKIADELRIRGNKAFTLNEDPSTVAEFYTGSIAFALPASQQLSFGYANRSAVLFNAQNYEDCLLDIERSFFAGYPDNLKAKLYARKVRCLIALKKSKTEIQRALEETERALIDMDSKAQGRVLVEKTLKDKDHLAPELIRGFPKKPKAFKPVIKDETCDIPGATGITIKYSKKYGRHIVATRDIEPGEIIATTEIYAKGRSQHKRYRECAQCAKRTMAGLPCDHCPNVVYCSFTCRDKAWAEYHETECPILGFLYDLEIPTSTLLGIRITLRALHEAGGVFGLRMMLKKLDSNSDPRGLTDGVFDCSKYAAIYSLTSHTGKHLQGDDFLMSFISTITVYNLATLTDIFGQKLNRDLRIFIQYPIVMFLTKVMVKNCEIVQVNGIRDGIPDAQGILDVQLAPFTALTNHSCSHNTISCGHDRSIAFALQPIKKGEQLWDCYLGMHFSHFPREKRQQLLKRDYHFKCDCIACVNNYPLFDELPNATEIPGISQTLKTAIEAAERVFLFKTTIGSLSGDLLSAKNEMAELLKLLHKHAFLSKEMFKVQELLKTFYVMNLE